MKKLILPFLILSKLSVFSQSKIGRDVINFNDNWLFAKGDSFNILQNNIVDKNWRHLSLPHDWAIEDSVSKNNPTFTQQGFFAAGIGHYRKHFKKEKSFKDKEIYILFDGVYMNADVYLNGKHLGFHSYGYAPFYYNITNLLQNENTLSVRVDNSKVPNERWYTGCGIYRNVWLLAVNKVHIPIWGTYITTSKISNSLAMVNVSTNIRNNSGKAIKGELLTEIRDANDLIVAKSELPISLNVDSTIQTIEHIKLANPNRWSLENPNLYKLISYIIINRKESDRYESTFGVREVAFTPDSGFVLNGEKTILKGVCLHHDLGSLGSAVNKRAMERRFEKLKEIGINAIRLSHNPHDPAMLDLCDKMGFLVFDEMYDKWDEKWPEWGYNGGATPFLDNWKDDLTNFVMRDRNHPSVFIWSVGNEVMEQLHGNLTKGDSIAKVLVGFVHKIEPSRKVTIGLHGDLGYLGSDHLEVPFVNSVDIVSCNYRTKDFKAFHGKYPKKIFLASETKGVREMDMKDYNQFDFLTNSWFDLPSYACGQFIWTGIDYFGESTGWPYRGNLCGIINSCGFRKPHSYFTESMYSEKPMVALAVQDDSIAQHLNTFNNWQLPWMPGPISCHWNWENKKDKQITVYAFSNCQKVKLLLNGKEMGEQIPANFKDKVARFEIFWESGTIEAIGINNNKEVSRFKLRTANKPTKIELIADRSTISADAVDISNIEVRVIDKNGTVCPFATNLLKFEVTGHGSIIGIDNGEMSQHFNFKGDEIQTANGKCLLIVQSKKQQGKMKVIAHSNGLPNSEIEIDVK